MGFSTGPRGHQGARGTGMGWGMGRVAGPGTGPCGMGVRRAVRVRSCGGDRCAYFAALHGAGNLHLWARPWISRPRMRIVPPAGVLLPCVEL